MKKYLKSRFRGYSSTFRRFNQRKNTKTGRKRKQ